MSYKNAKGIKTQNCSKIKKIKIQLRLKIRINKIDQKGYPKAVRNKDAFEGQNVKIIKNHKNWQNGQK